MNAAIDAVSIDHAGWPVSRLGDAMAALAAKAALTDAAPEPVNPIVFSSDAQVSAWMERHAKFLGCEAEPIESTLADLERDLPEAYPALLRTSDEIYLAVVEADRRNLYVLTPDLRREKLPLGAVCDWIREPLARAKRTDIDRLFVETDISRPNDLKIARLLMREQLTDMRFDRCWTLRSSPGARPIRWLREPRAFRNLGRLLAAHTVQYVLWIASWAILGRLFFLGYMDRGWLLAWALLLLTIAPFRLLTTWLQGALAIGVGGILKRRLLAGAMRLEPEEVRHQGMGSFLGQVFEAEALETLALSGGIAGLLATIEVAIAAVVLGRFAVLLLVWFCLAAILAWCFVRRYRGWTDTRLRMTHDLIEAMVGNRTRLAQQPRAEWHEAEDRALTEYIQVSQSMDASAMWLVAAIPRGWLLVGLGCLAPAIVAGRTPASEIAIVLGGVLLAYTAFKRLAGSFVEIAGAWVPWKRIRPLFRAASRAERLGEMVIQEPVAASHDEDLPDKVIDADRLTFRYRSTGNPALQACSLAIRRGERVLLEGPSGGGKTTFASLLAGMRQPQSGLLLLHGLDRQTLGDRRWREQIAAAPQFHENHILTETLAFNLLMGRGWPPSQNDLDLAEAMCRELGLGELIDRLPSGLQQMVGEGGWQLSHGERSRVFIARALLQSAGLVILDESFAALDPENLRTALECSLARAQTLLVIAHP